jgi:hypothetical protein
MRCAPPATCSPPTCVLLQCAWWCLPGYTRYQWTLGGCHPPVLLSCSLSLSLSLWLVVWWLSLLFSFSRTTFVCALVDVFARTPTHTTYARAHHTHSLSHILSLSLIHASPTHLLERPLERAPSFPVSRLFTSVTHNSPSFSQHTLFTTPFFIMGCMSSKEKKGTPKDQHLEDDQVCFLLLLLPLFLPHTLSRCSFPCSHSRYLLIFPIPFLVPHSLSHSLSLSLLVKHFSILLCM